MAFHIQKRKLACRTLYFPEIKVITANNVSEKCCSVCFMIVLILLPMLSFFMLDMTLLSPLEIYRRFGGVYYNLQDQ
jgi:hypothetical protein